MLSKRILWLILPASLLLVLTNCASSPTISSIQLTPANANLGTVGDTVQFRAVGTFTRGKHPQETRDITSEVTWASSQPSAATVSSSGLGTDVGVGTTTITASMKGDLGDVIGSATLTASGHDLQSLSIIPISQTLFAIGETAQFVAVGVFNSSPLTQDMTDQVTWRSTDVNLAVINAAGLATAVNCSGTTCQTTVTASALSTSGATITSSNAATLTITPGTGGTNLPSLAVYQVGLGTGTITSSPVGINCSTNSLPPGAGCSANFVLNTTVTLTATPAVGSQFGGWSANCTPSTSTTCSVNMNNSDAVGVIFN
jgi:hypothetical protein